MNKFSSYKLASRLEQAQAKKVSLHKIISPKEYAVLGEGQLEKIEPFLSYSYSDDLLSSWFEELRSILNDSDAHMKLIQDAELVEMTEREREREGEDEDEDEWFVDLDKLREYFEPWELPWEIVEIVKYQNRRRDYFCPSLSMTSEGKEIAQHLVAKEASKIRVFAETRDGSCFGYWVRGAISKSPIVFIDCDIEGTQVVASTFDEFICMLLSKKEDVSVEDETSLDLFFNSYYQDTKDFVRLKRWLVKKFGLEELQSRRAVTSKASKKYPDLESWASTL